MADLIFPNTLGSPLQAGWSETGPNLVFRTSMDEGPQKTRRWGTAGSGKIQISYVWSSSQRTTWKDFYNNSISNGALSFDWYHPIDKKYIKVKIQNVPIESLVTYNTYGYTLELEVLP